MSNFRRFWVEQLGHSKIKNAQNRYTSIVAFIKDIPFFGSRGFSTIKSSKKIFGQFLIIILLVMGFFIQPVCSSFIIPQIVFFLGGGSRMQYITLHKTLSACRTLRTRARFKAQNLSHVSLATSFVKTPS